MHIVKLINSSALQGQFGAPLGGVTALDLLESFGFEGGLEAVTQEPSSPTAEFPFRCKLFASFAYLCL